MNESWAGADWWGETTLSLLPDGGILRTGKSGNGGKVRGEIWIVWEMVGG